ncbi:MAG: GNAT family N-acetyltransferase, partial [Acidimicrobiales bacterium]
MVLRAAGPGDDAGIRAVIARAFPDNPKSRADILAWQYWDNPFGSTCAWVWEDGDRIVAHYSGYPVPAVVGGRQGVLAIGVDAAVAPDYQGRGLFRPLSAALYEDCAGHGMAGTVCFPNDNSRKGITAAGWVPVGRLRTHVLALDDAWLGRRLHAPDRLAGAARSLAFPAARAGARADPFRGRAAG